MNMLFGHDTAFLEADSRCRGFIEETKNDAHFPWSEREKDFKEMIEIRQQSWRKMERILAQFSVDVGNIIYLIDDETHTWIKKIILELLESSSDMKETTQ